MFMDWQEKIKRVLDGQNAARLARAAGLHVSAISQVAAGQMPRAGKAIKIAKALGVSADWLFDDDQDWPPPSAAKPEPKSLAGVSDFELIVELDARFSRMRAVYNELLDKIEATAKAGGASIMDDEELGRFKSLITGAIRTSRAYGDLGWILMGVDDSTFQIRKYADEVLGTNFMDEKDREVSRLGEPKKTPARKKRKKQRAKR